MDMNALKKIQYGMYIISSSFEGKMSAQIANTVFQTTSDPVQFAVSLSKQNFTYELVDKSGKFSVTALSEEAPFEFIGKFGFKSGRNTDKFEKINYEISPDGIPVILDFAAAVFEAEVVKKLDMDSHILFLGRITGMKVIDESKNTMTYDYYHKIKGGLMAKNAPTYIKK
jgi:Conserved protein/domain typically associated with flavoprotein oxygenases, DIM6/NTAB family